jgi:hypothetical protein
LDIIPPLGAVVLIRTFLKFIVLCDDFPLPAILAVLTIASDLSNPHAAEVALTLTVVVERDEASDSVDQIMDLMRVLTGVASETESDECVSSLLTCTQTLISCCPDLYAQLHEEILETLVAYVRDMNQSPPYRVFPEMVRLINCIATYVSGDCALSTARQIEPIAYWLSLLQYKAPDFAPSLDILMVFLVPLPRVVNQFGAIVAHAEYEPKNLWLEFLYRGALADDQRFFWLGLHSAVVVHFADLLDDFSSHAEAYLGFLRFMSDPCRDLLQEDLTNLVRSFFMKRFDDTIRAPFMEQPGSVVARIRDILVCFSVEDAALCFTSHFTNTTVNLWQEALAVRNNLHTLNPNGFADDEYSEGSDDGQSGRTW